MRIKKELNFHLIDTQFSNLEVLISYLLGKSCIPVVLALHHLHPNLTVNTFRKYCLWFTKKCLHKKVNILFLGDVNVPSIDWSACQITTCFYIKG